MSKFVAEHDVPLEGVMDVDAAIARSVGQTTKGMFFTRLADRLRDRWREIEPALDKPPRLGRYVPFVDYPSCDHVRLVRAAAHRSYPLLSEREGHRRLGRLGLEDFKSSRVGSVFLAMLGGPREALLRFPTGWKMSVRNSTEVRCEEKPKGVILHFEQGAVLEPEYLLGTIEAVVRHWGTTPRTTVTIDDTSTHYDVELVAGASIA